MKQAIDLHMHSTYSDDGQFTPAELVRQCAQAGIRVMAVSDHNCARANAEARREAAALGIRTIPAIEIDCLYQGIQLHVLGYGIDDQSPDFEQIEKNIAEQCAEASRKMLRATQAMGFAIAEREMEALTAGRHWKDCWTGEMFAETLLAKPEYRDCELLRPYRPGGSRSDNPLVNFYWDFYSQGKPCYAPIQLPSIEDVVAIIHRNGGRAVLAHPGIQVKDEIELLRGILAAGVDGIEAFSSYHTADRAQFYYGKARELGVFVTCGSDYHGKTKPAIRLGGHGCSLNEEEMRGQIDILLSQI